MTKTQKLTQIAADMAECVNHASIQRDRYYAVLERLGDDDEISTSDFEASDTRVFQMLVMADMIASKALVQHISVDFVQSLLDNFEVYELAYRTANEARAEIEALRANKAAQEKAAEDEWPDNLTIH